MTTATMLDVAAALVTSLPHPSRRFGHCSLDKKCRTRVPRSALSVQLKLGDHQHSCAAERARVARQLHGRVCALLAHSAVTARQ